MFDKTVFTSDLVDRNIIGISKNGTPISSGGTTGWYVNGRDVTDSTTVLSATAKYAVDFMIENGLVTDGLDAVLGVPEGALDLGKEINRRLIEGGYIKNKLYIPRIVPKEHGNPKAKFWVNGNVPGLVVPFEDTVTTGDSIFLKIIDRLRESGVRVEAVLGMVDRLHLRDGLTVEERFEGEGLKFYSMTDAKLLLPELVGRIIDPEERTFVINMLNREFQKMYEDAGRESPINLEELK